MTVRRRENEIKRKGSSEWKALRAFFRFRVFLFAQLCSVRALCNRMRIECRARETERLLLFALSLGLLLGGCASDPQVKLAAQVFDSEKAKSRSVAIVPDLYMDDPAEADKLAELMRGQLTLNRFKVRETENEAELVVISTIERSKPTSTGTAPPPRAWRSFDLSYGLGRANMMESQNALRNLGFEFGSAAPTPEQLKAGLMVTAVTRGSLVQASSG